MVWDFIHHDKSETINILLSKAWGDAVAHALNKNILWVVHKIEGRAWINCFVLSFRRVPSPGWYIRRDGEDDCTTYVNCPLDLLKLAPVYSYRWRLAVHRYHRVGCSLRRSPPARTLRHHRHRPDIILGRCSERFFTYGTASGSPGATP